MSTASYEHHFGTWRPTAGLPLTDRGFRHGMSAFATIRIHNGHLIALEAHLEKLRHTCAQLGLRQPPDSISVSLPTSGTARLTITAGDGPFRAPLDTGRILLMVEAAPSLPSSLPSGAPTTLSISSTAHSPVWPSLKTGNYWPNITAYRQAAELHTDEIVLVNASNHVISASLANLFAMIDGLLLTPRVSSGARAGVMRDWVIARTDTIVSDFHPEQLREASEIFLTGSGYGIGPIATLEGKPVSTQTLGHELRTAYLDWLETT